MNTALVAISLGLAVSGLLLAFRPCSRSRRASFYSALLDELDRINSELPEHKRHYWVNLTPPSSEQMYDLDIVSYAYYPRQVEEPYYHDRVGNYDLYWSKPHGPDEKDSRLIIASCQYMAGMKESCTVYVPASINELMDFYSTEVANPIQWKRICGSLINGEQKGMAVRHMLLYTLCTGHVDRDEGFLIF